MSFVVWIPIHEEIGSLLYNQMLHKGASHKYIKRVPYTSSTGKRRYRYFYNVGHGKGVGHDNHYVEGASFQGPGGHYHIRKVDSDGIFVIWHDEKNQEEEYTQDELKELILGHHKESLEQHKEKLKQEISSAKTHGTEKQISKLQEHLKNIHGEEGESEQIEGEPEQTESEQKDVSYKETNIEANNTDTRASADIKFKVVGMEMQNYIRKMMNERVSWKMVKKEYDKETQWGKENLQWTYDSLKRSVSYSPTMKELKKTLKEISKLKNADEMIAWLDQNKRMGSREYGMWLKGEDVKPRYADYINSLEKIALRTRDDLKDVAMRKPSSKNSSEIVEKHNLGSIQIDESMHKDNAKFHVQMLSNALDDLREAIGFSHFEHGQLRIKISGEGSFNPNGPFSLGASYSHASDKVGNWDQKSTVYSNKKYNDKPPTINISTEAMFAFAHEFGHSMDDLWMFGDKTDSVRNQIADIKKKLKETTMLQRSKEKDVERSGDAFSAAKSSAYWATTVEMFARAFEQYVFHKMESKGKMNNFLTHSNYDSAVEGGVYMDRKEFKPFNEMFDDLMKNLKDNNIMKSLFLGFPTIIKGIAPPKGGWVAIPGSKRGGYHKKTGSGYEYWYPGDPGGPSQEEKTEAPQKTTDQTPDKQLGFKTEIKEQPTPEVTPEVKEPTTDDNADVTTDDNAEVEKEPSEDLPKDLSEEEDTAESAQKVRDMFEGYEIKSYEYIFDNSHMHENLIVLGQGAFGRAVIDRTFKDKEGKTRPCVVKYGIMSHWELEVNRELGNLGIAPVIISDQMSDISLDDDRLHETERMISYYQDEGILQGEESGDEEDEYYEADDPRGRPEHLHESRKKHFGDFIEKVKEEHNERIENDIFELEEKQEALDKDDEDYQDEFDELQEEIDRIREGEDEHDLSHIDEDVVTALNEAGIYHTSLGINIARGHIDKQGKYEDDHYIGSRIAMEYLDGYEPLEDYFGRDVEEIFDKDEALEQSKLAISLLDNINTMHRAGYVHNDLHGQNIMHDYNESKLIDFGLASQLTHNSNDWRWYSNMNDRAYEMLERLDHFEENDWGSNQYPEFNEHREDFEDGILALDEYITENHQKMNNREISPEEFAEESAKYINRIKDGFRKLEDYLS